MHELPRSLPYNGENRRSLSHSYQKLFQKYPIALFFETDLRNKYLSREAFCELTAYKTDYKSFDCNYITDIMEKYGKLVKDNIHIDFDRPSSLSDIHYKILTGFTRRRHGRVLPYVPLTVLKISFYRSFHCALT